MRFTKKKDDASTIRKVWSDDKAICFGIVGTVDDLLAGKIFDYYNGPKDLWAFIPRNDANNTQFGDSREAACRNITA